MNILRTRLILVSLALVIPLSLQAYSFKNLTNSLASAWNLSSRSCKDLAKTINAKKKTIAATLALGGALCFGSLKLVDWFYSSWPIYQSRENMLSLYPDLNADILFAAERGFKEMGKTIRSSQMIAISVSLGLTLKLMLKAHDHNLFGEQ